MAAFDPLRTLAGWSTQQRVIGIGSDFGGPEHKGSKVREVLIRAMNVAANNRSANYDDGHESWINPIFIVPGSLFKPDFVGIERGYFSRKKKGLVLKIAVPESVVNGDGLADFVITALRESVRIASEHFTAKGMSFSTLGAEKIIRQIEREIARS
jgi:hypothetical protein